MATLGGIALNLVDVAKRTDPTGKIAKIAELLSQKNEVLDDMVSMEANGITGHRVSVRTGLPTAFWRALNQPVPPSKSTTAQMDEAIGMLENYSQVDVDVAKLGGNVNDVRLSEAYAMVEGISQQMTQALIYGDTTVNPERILGFAPRFSAIAGAANGQNVMSAGGSGSDNTSVWLVGWGDNTVYTTYPKGSQAGLMHEDLGIETVTGTAGITGSLMRAYRDHWQWKLGLVVKDWRYVVRLCNIDTSDLVGSTGTQNAQQMINLLSRMLDRIPDFAACNPALYMNRTVFSLLRVQALAKSSSALAIEPGLSQFGNPVRGRLSFFGIPIHKVDQILTTEATIT